VGKRKKFPYPNSATTVTELTRKASGITRHHNR